MSVIYQIIYDVALFEMLFPFHFTAVIQFARTAKSTFKATAHSRLLANTKNGFFCSCWIVLGKKK